MLAGPPLPGSLDDKDVAELLAEVSGDTLTDDCTRCRIGGSAAVKIMVLAIMDVGECVYEDVASSTYVD